MDSLNESFRTTLVGGGLVSEGVGLARRNGGPASGSITISGIPEGSSVAKALLYWSVIAGDDPVVTLNGSGVLGGQIGRSPETCYFNSRDSSHDNRVYRADVTSIVTGNGTFTVAGVGDVLSPADGQGASLLVLYKNESADFQRTIIINDGAATGGNPGQHYGSIAHTFGSLPTARPVLGAKLHFGFGDGQPEFPEGAMTVGGQQVLGPNSLSGADGPSWDDAAVPVPASLFPVGTSSVLNRLQVADTSGGDCVLWTYAALVLEQQKSLVPAPTIVITSPEPGTQQTSPVTIEGTSTNASGIVLTEHGQTLATTTPSGSGAWSVSVALAGGHHDVTATALDLDGIPGATAGVGFHVYGAPAGPLQITSPTFGSVNTVTSLSVAGTTEQGVSVRLSEYGNTIATVPVSNGSWAASLTFSEGAHQVNAQALDANGNPVNAWSFVEFAVDLSPPQISMEGGDFPFALPLVNTEIAFNVVTARGMANDAVGLRRVIVTVKPIAPASESWTVEANCGGCQPTLCMQCGNWPAHWYADIELPEPGLYEISATAFDHAGRSTRSNARRFLRFIPAGTPDPFEFLGPPNCLGPLEETPVCFDPFEDGIPFPFGN
ncbi:MAG TPA: DUF3344 domain-containing protein [Actinomycetota bacterium]|nr:DUF3344 domain-containing protein [Actinomycetota bacterium]